MLGGAWASAHIGSPNVVFDGQAGPYPVRVVIKPPGVVPGLAEIIVRVLDSGVRQVTVLPVHSRAGMKGAPPPDLARLVRGETNVYEAELWLMTGGAYSVNVHLEGKSGPGTVIVPVNSVATRRLEIEPWMGGLLLALGMVLILLMVSIAGAAVRESVLEAGVNPTRGRLWLSRGAKLLAVMLLAGGAYGGKAWWGGVDRDYRRNRMFQPYPLETAVWGEGERQILRLEVGVPDINRRRWSPLVPDHGKWMHLFVIREPGLDVFAHLHPVRRTEHRLEVLLPPLPPGTYQAYADITHENGFAQTLTATIELPGTGRTGPDENPESGRTIESLVPDPEDAWLASSSPVGGSNTGHLDRVQPLPGGFTITRLDQEPLRTDRDATLRFAVADAHGQAAVLRPTLGMYSHAVLLKLDGSVFNHVHPLGTISMAAQQVMQLRAQDKGPALVTAEALEAICQDPPPTRNRLPLEFPVWFPQPGAYRLWVQMKPEGAEGLLTGVFDLEVGPPK